jgi:hypothetical protein
MAPSRSGSMSALAPLLGDKRTSNKLHSSDLIYEYTAEGEPPKFPHGGIG